MCGPIGTAYTCTMTSTLPTAPATETAHDVATAFLSALERRDFHGAATLLAPHASIRALTPKRVFEGAGPAFLEERLTTWFGGDDAYAVVGTTDVLTGVKHNLTWRIALADPEGAVRQAEQHAFARISDRIESIDLVCSGFWDA